MCDVCYKRNGKGHFRTRTRRYGGGQIVGDGQRHQTDGRRENRLYRIYGKTDLESINDFIRLHHHAILLGITVLTALDTANALADIIASKFTEDNTELVDINHLRKEKLQLSFTKMQSCGNDYIYFDNRDGKITCPESIAINYVNIHYGIGGDGIVLIENSDVADAKMRISIKTARKAAWAEMPFAA